ncbi:hypothetical protein [Tautonia marina]|uniref:hypothetical protein n=1 Tax=Tautonia marina TaxID=2653855 RepID=UPI00126070C4|nr:hypothetical protein [Tautonia marina]
MTLAPPAAAPKRPRSPRLPLPIRKALRGVDRRLRLAGIMTGLGWLLGTLAVIVAAVMVLDGLRPMSDPTRWAVWLAGVGLASIGLALILLRAAFRRPTRQALAAVAERACPDAGDRLSTAVALVEDGELAHGSPALIAALVDRAADDARAIAPRLAVPLRRPRRRLTLGLAAVALVTLPPLLVPDPFALLARRVLMPWTDPGTAGRLAILVEPGDTLLARGDSLTISAVVHSRFGPSVPDSAQLEWADASGASHSLTMGLGSPLEGSNPDDQTFALTLPSVEDAITYRITAGSARSRAFRISVVDPPRIVSQRWTITPPSYTGLPASTIDDPSSSVVVAWQDSLVAITTTTDLPSRRVTLDWTEEDGSIAPISLSPASDDTDGTIWTAEVVATGSGRFSLTAADAQGLTDRSGPSGRLEVQPDAPPAVALGAGAEAVGPGDRLVVPVASRDDLAVTAAELHVTINRLDSPHDEPEQEVIPLTLDGLGSPSAKGLAEFDLTPLALNDGDTVSLRVRVIDSLPPPRGPNEAWSSPRPVAIVADIERHTAEQRDEALRPIREALEDLARQAAEDRLRSGPLRAAAEAAQRDPRRWSDRQQSDLDRLAESAQERVDRLQALAESLRDDAMLGPIGDAIRQAAEAEPEAARAALNDAQTAETADRPDDLRRAEQELAATSDRLDDLSERLDDLARAAAARPELANLARQESDLADQAEAMTAPPKDPAAAEPSISPEALEQLRQAQEQLTQALADLIERTPELDEAAQSARAEADAAQRDLEQAGGDPSQASDAARSAADAMRRAAEQLRQASGPADPNAQAEQLAQMLAQSSGSAPPSAPTDQEPSAPPSGSTAAGQTDPDADLNLRSDRLWGSLPGHLRTEMLRSSTDRYHPDYASLIRLYFQEIARASSAPAPEPPGPTPSTPTPPPAP